MNRGPPLNPSTSVVSANTYCAGGRACVCLCGGACRRCHQCLLSAPCHSCCHPRWPPTSDPGSCRWGWQPASARGVGWGRVRARAHAAAEPAATTRPPEPARPPLPRPHPHPPRRPAHPFRLLTGSREPVAGYFLGEQASWRARPPARREPPSHSAPLHAALHSPQHRAAASSTRRYRAAAIPLAARSGITGRAGGAPFAARHPCKPPREWVQQRRVAAWHGVAVCSTCPVYRGCRSPPRAH